MTYRCAGWLSRHAGLAAGTLPAALFAHVAAVIFATALPWSVNTRAAELELDDNRAPRLAVGEWAIAANNVSTSQFPSDEASDGVIVT